MSSSALSNVRIVLVEPRYGGNIGQCARAMLNMGLTRLVLVSPREHLSDEARWMAREGQGLLEEAQVCGTLQEALAPVTLAIGTTRRVGKYRRPIRTPGEAVRDILPLLRENQVAFVFGREVSGLTSEELDRCQWIVSIPASKSFPSLNLAQAVLICCYELFVAVARQEALRGPDPEARRLAGPALLERFFAHLQDVLREIRFLVGDQAPAILRTLRRIFGRADLDPRDLRILHGILAQMDWYRRRGCPSGQEGIRWARAGDWPAIMDLLSECGLPAAGLHPPGSEPSSPCPPGARPQNGAGGEGSPASLCRVLVSHEAGGLSGCVALELHGVVALLRSLAVRPARRGQGMGRALVAEALAEARRCSVEEVYLLTTTASEFFTRLGFEPAPRSSAPTALHASAEWEGCCAGAAPMRLALAPSPASRPGHA